MNMMAMMMDRDDSGGQFPLNTRPCYNTVLKLARRLRLCPRINSILGEPLLFAVSHEGPAAGQSLGGGGASCPSGELHLTSCHKTDST